MIRVKRIGGQSDGLKPGRARPSLLQEPAVEVVECSGRANGAPVPGGLGMVVYHQHAVLFALRYFD